MQQEILSDLGNGPDDECLECGCPTESVCDDCSENVCDDCLDDHNEWEHGDQESELSD